jgi:hypothetical protein
MIKSGYDFDDGMFLLVLGGLGRLMGLPTYAWGGNERETGKIIYASLNGFLKLELWIVSRL